jgi:hypothetical protein
MNKWMDEYAGMEDECEEEKTSPATSTPSVPSHFHNLGVKRPQ